MTEALTQSQVDALEDGTEVTITWSGGNGPFVYEIVHLNGVTYAQRRNGRRNYNLIIDFVGFKAPYTVVKLV